MRIYSLKVRDDAKKDPGCAVVELSGLELIALNNILCKRWLVKVAAVLSCLSTWPAQRIPQTLLCSMGALIKST